MQKFKECLDSFKIAISMYSALPVPQTKWSREGDRYVLCFFPLVGLVIGALFAGWTFLAASLGVSRILRDAVLVLIPVAVTGGIHLDGFLDTCDALHSWRTKEERLRILKDPHAGAFAVIWGIVYFLLFFAAVDALDTRMACVASCGFVISRALSAFSVVRFKKASEEGTVAGFARDADSPVIVLSALIYLILAAVLMFVLSPLYALAALLAAALCFALYYRQAMKYFGGINGDLAGYFLSLCELVIPLFLVLFSLLF